MTEINYIGEHLFPGQIGQFLVILAFACALASSIAFYKSANSSDNKLQLSWKNLGRITFLIHGISVIGIIVILYIIISSHYFEYHYAWQHSSNALPWYYRFSCFWEGQEGSFLLWSLWHVILGGLLIWSARKWEAPLMSVVSLVQVFLGSMLLGIYFFGYKIGSSPFLLLRDVMTDAPIFSTGRLPEFRGRWFRSEPLAPKLLDGDSSPGFVSRFCIHTHSFCLCHGRFVEK